MPESATLLPTRRPELLIRPLGDNDQFVVKDPGTGGFFHLGAQEHFLLTQLDGRQDAEAVCTAFAERFDQPLSAEELREFVEMLEAQGWLSASGGRQAPDRSMPDHSMPDHSAPEEMGPSPQGANAPRSPANAPRSPTKRQSILHWRKNLFDPDRLFTWLEPKLWFFWTRAFLVLSVACIVSALILVWVNWQEVVRSFQAALHWETALLVWLTLIVVTTFHESAHGLTCKHYGGEVHEIGFLLLFFMPCFYCNVSDAWLFKEKSKRLWVTLAGGYFELFLWALAVFVWRLTLPGSLPNHLAFIVLSVCGVQTLFNLLPLLKLDGYYLVSDWLEVPNLQQRSQDYFKSWCRRLLWGAPRPAREPRRRLLFSFGLASWLYSIVFLAVLLWGLVQLAASGWGWLALPAAGVFGFLAMRGLLGGLAAGEVSIMITKRRIRTFIWVLIVGGLAAILCFVKMEDRASGNFVARPAVRAELRARAAGFIRDVYCDEGDRVSSGTLVLRLEIPDLSSRLAQKRAETVEAKARLRLLEAGTRPEELAEHRRRVERAEAWRDLGRHELTQKRKALAEELARLEQHSAACRAELTAAQEAFERSRALLGRGATAQEDHRAAESKYLVCRAKLDQAEADHRARQTQGTLEAEAEAARRDKELADTQGNLALLEAGSRPQQIDAARACLAKLDEELRYLEELHDKQQVCSLAPGLITTARLREKVGQYVREGDLICLVEEPDSLEVEIALAEQDVERVRPGQAVALKARALPFETLSAHVTRIAPAATPGQAETTVTVGCQLSESHAALRPGMTGYARFYTGARPLGAILGDRVLRLLRTEFWW